MKDWIKELKRELAMRSYVYPEQVRKNKLSADTAKRRMEILREIIDYFESVENAQQKLF